MWSIIQAAGWPIWPLIIASIIALALIFERLWSLRQSVVAPAGMVDHVLVEFRHTGATQDLLARTAEHRGLDPSQAKPGNAVNVRILYQEDHEDLVPRIRQAAGASLACYGMWFGAYPYATLTIVSARAAASCFRQIASEKAGRIPEGTTRKASRVQSVNCRNAKYRSRPTNPYSPPGLGSPAAARAGRKR